MKLPADIIGIYGRHGTYGLREIFCFTMAGPGAHIDPSMTHIIPADMIDPKCYPMADIGSVTGLEFANRCCTAYQETGRESGVAA